MKPLTTKYGYSAGNGGGSEWLTFDRSELPPVGTEAFVGTGPDRCSDSGADVPAADLEIG